MFSSYAYFALDGEDFDPDEITKRLKVTPTNKYRKGEKGQYINKLKYSQWTYASQKKENALDIDTLVTQAIKNFIGKEKEVLKLKEEYNLSSTLRIVLWIDTNENSSTPFIGHNLTTIDFLYNTRSETDVDIYRYNSSEIE